MLNVVSLTDTHSRPAKLHAFCVPATQFLVKIHRYEMPAETTQKKINQYKPILYIYLNYIPQIGQDATTLCLWFCNPPRPAIVLSLTQHPLILVLLYYPPRRNALQRYNGKWGSNNQAHKCDRNVSIQNVKTCVRYLNEMMHFKGYILQINLCKKLAVVASIRCDSPGYETATV